MSCTAADLINIQPLTLSDTFHTWFDRTNEVIGSVNAVNIYDVSVGVTSGLQINSGCESGYYNGSITIDTNVGGGVGIGSALYRTNEIVIDFADLTPFTVGGVTANPDIADYYIVSDVSETEQGPAGTPRRIAARHMLPSKVTMGETGGGTLEIEGSLVVDGDLNVLGNQTFIQVDDLRIEDKIIELASSPYTAFTIQGPTSSIENIESGMTGLFWSEGDPLSIGNEEVRFKVRSIQRESLGTTAYIQIHKVSFGEESLPDSIVVNGSVYLFNDSNFGAPPASGLTFNVSTAGVGGKGLFEDAVLSPAGVRVKGEEGDKDFLWTNTHNRFATNTNLGLDKSYSLLVGSKFGSYGYSDNPTTIRDNIFSFVGVSGQDTTLEIANGSVTVTGDNWKNSSWKFTKKATPGALQNYQKLEFVHDSGATAYPIATFYAGRTGPTYTGVGVSGWAQHLNADMLDGAHAYQTSTPYSIPVGGADGKIDAAWVSSEWIGKKYSIAGGHAFVVGDVVRIDAGTGGLTYAIADTVSEAEAIGMISVVDNITNTVTVVTKGFIPSLPSTFSAYPAVTGNVYFLSATTPGGLIDNPDTGGIDAGEVRKPMFLATGISSGYVLDFVGSIFGGDVTDQVYMPTVNPVGSVQPFAGPTAGVPQGWLLCDGRAYGRLAYSDLFGAIGNNHFANANTVNETIIVFADNTRGLAVGNTLKIEWTLAAGGITSADATVTGVNTGTRQVTLSGVNLPAANYPVRVYGRVAGSDANMVFFVPDLRGRAAFGVSTLNVPIDPTVAIGLGVQGGNTTTTVPDHKHFHKDTVISDGAGSFYAEGNGMVYTGGVTGTGTTPIMPPYVGLHWIIRAVKILPAMIITGHHHDNRYIRYDAVQTINDAGKNQFHTNAAVLSDGTIGADTFYNKLTINHMEMQGGMEVTSSDWSWWSSGIRVINAGTPGDQSPNNRSYWENSALNVMGSSSTLATINVFNNNAGNYSYPGGAAYADLSTLNFWGVGISGATYPARYIFGIGANIEQIGPSGYDSVLGRNRRTASFYMGGMTDGYSVMTFQREEDPTTQGPNAASWNNKVRVYFNRGLTQSTVHTGQMKHVMLRGNTELVEYTGTSLSGSSLHVTGEVKVGQGSLSSDLDSDAKILTVDADTGIVHTRKMIEVTGSSVPEGEAVNAYPEGFVWYKTTQGGSVGANTPGTVPVGSIVIWSGTIGEALALASAGWALCDGRSVTVNGVERTTPDLRGRFIVGAMSGTTPPSSGGDYSVGTIGGENLVQLTVEQLPMHSHRVIGTNGGGVNQNLNQNGQSPINFRNNPALFTGNGGPLNQGGNAYYITTTSTTDPDSDDSDWACPSQNVGLNDNHENRPPYYALAYIMRIF